MAGGAPILPLDRHFFPALQSGTSKRCFRYPRKQAGVGFCSSSPPSSTARIKTKKSAFQGPTCTNRLRMRAARGRCDLLRAPLGPNYCTPRRQRRLTKRNEVCTIIRSFNFEVGRRSRLKNGTVDITPLAQKGDLVHQSVFLHLIKYHRYGTEN